MNVLSREAILGAQDLKPTAIDVPEWNGTVYVRQLTGAERGALESEAMSDRANHIATLRQRMAVRCLCDADGKRLFTDADAPALAQKSAAALDRIFAAIAKVSALGDEGLATVGETSTGVPSAGSGSDSP